MKAATRALPVTLAAAIAALTAISCAGEEVAGWSADPREARTPAGAPLLRQLDSDGDVAAAVAWAAIEIDTWRPRGVTRLLAALRVNLAARGVDSAALDGIDDQMIGSPLSRHATSAPAASPGVGSQRQGLGGDEIASFFECPILAPESNSGTSCDDLVQAVVVQVRDAITGDSPLVERQMSATYDGLPPAAHQFLAAWAVEAEAFGAKLAAIYAAQELRAAGACDDKTNAHVVAHQLGVEQGGQIVEELTVWAESQLAACLVETDVVAEQVRAMSRKRVTGFMKKHPVCVDVDLSSANEALVAAEKIRKEGILAGIDRRVEILRVELFNKRKALPCYCDVAGFSLEVCGETPKGGSCWVDRGGWKMSTTPDSTFRSPGWLRNVDGIDFCCRVKGGRELCVGAWPNGQTGYCQRDGACMRCDCQHGHVGSPLVLDIDDDGIDFATQPARFDLLADGAPLQTSWVGPREPLLAIDLDGDGAITSGRELFGNYASCLDGRCYDGVAALAAWDAPQRGGNGDGRVDARDAVWSRLLLWRDENGDGISAAAELRSAVTAGIEGISLQADRGVQRLQLGTVSARLRVDTARGPRTAHDVWFRTRPAVSNLVGAMLPRR